MTDIQAIRDILRNWGTYGPLPDFPEGTAYGHRPIPVDDLSDEEVIEIARVIAEQPRPSRSPLARSGSVPAQSTSTNQEGDQRGK